MEDQPLLHDDTTDTLGFVVIEHVVNGADLVVGRPHFGTGPDIDVPLWYMDLLFDERHIGDGFDTGRRADRDDVLREHSTCRPAGVVGIGGRRWSDVMG